MPRKQIHTGQPGPHRQLVPQSIPPYQQDLIIARSAKASLEHQPEVKDLALDTHALFTGLGAQGVAELYAKVGAWLAEGGQE